MCRRSSGPLYVALLACVDHTLLVARGPWGSKRAVDKTITQFAEAVRIDFRKDLDDAHRKEEGMWFRMLLLAALTLRTDGKGSHKRSYIRM